MKNVLLLVHDDAGQEARLRAALEVVRAVDGHLTCLDVLDPIDANLRAFGGTMAAMVIKQAATIERHNKSLVERRLESEMIDFSWIDSTEDLATAIEDAARLAQLVVMNTHLPESDQLDMVRAMRKVVGRLHAPILAVPPKGTGFNCRGPAVVLWDGSPDADVALCAASRLLRLASEVTVLQITSEAAAPAPRRALDFLQQQGVVARSSVHVAMGESPARRIERYLRSHEPAWAVMGAFGHGRVHSTLFGSVTTHLLANSQTPLLLARDA